MNTMAKPHHQSESQKTSSPIHSNHKYTSEDAIKGSSKTRIPLQTIGLEFGVRKGSIDEILSPRTAVAVKFQQLGLRGSPGSFGVGTTQEASLEPEPESVRSEAGITESQHRGPPNKARLTQKDMPEPTLSNAAVAEEANMDSTLRSTTEDISHSNYLSKVGTHTATPGIAAVPATPSKRARFVSVDMTQSQTPTSSPAKRRRTSTPPPPATTPRTQPFPLSLLTKKHSPSPKSTAPTSPPDTTDIDANEPDPDLSEFWWQPSEITGHSPTDPDEDDRGVNGIGYQKTRTEAWSISQKKKKQIADWRAREAKEARALRLGGRRGMGVTSGRVTKSRSGSPVAAENRRRTLLSPKKEREEQVARAVRFETS